MAKYLGNDGVVETGGTNVLNITAWTATETRAAVDVTALADAAKDFKRGKPMWSGTISMFWDHGDTTGQKAIVDDADEVAVELYWTGNASSQWKLTGNVIITSIEDAFSGPDQPITRSFQWTAAGAMTWAQVS